MPFKVVEFPAFYKFVETDATKKDYMAIGDETVELLSKCDTMVFVVDALYGDPWEAELMYVHLVATIVRQVNPNTHLELLIHKMDEDWFPTAEARTEPFQHTMNSLRSLSGEKDRRPIFCGRRGHYHLTSIYDCSIFQAFSKILARLIPEYGFLETSLDHLKYSCQLKHAILFDAVSRTYISTDSVPLESELFEMCSELVKLTVDVMSVYGSAMSGKQASDDEAFSPGAAVTMKLDNGDVFYLKRVAKLLALVIVMSEDTYRKMLLIERNVDSFQRTLAEFLQLKKKGAEARSKWEAEEQKREADERQRKAAARGKRQVLRRQEDGIGSIKNSRADASSDGSNKSRRDTDGRRSKNSCSRVDASGGGIKQSCENTGGRSGKNSRSSADIGGKKPLLSPGGGGMNNSRSDAGGGGDTKGSRTDAGGGIESSRSDVGGGGIKRSRSDVAGGGMNSRQTGRKVTWADETL